MIRNRRTWNRGEEGADDQILLHCPNHSCSTYSEQISFDHSNGTRLLPPIHPFQSICGGRFALWLCLLLLQQPYRSFGNLVTRGASQSLPTIDDSLSPVNIFLRNLSLLNARQERKGSAKSPSSEFVARRLKSGQNFSQFVQRGKIGTPSFSFSSSITSPTKWGALSQKYSNLKSAFSPPHSTGVQTTRRQPPHKIDKVATTADALTTYMRRLRQPSDGVFGNRDYEPNPKVHHMMRLPSPHRVQVFINYISSYTKQNINPLQIQFIINQWHLFRKTQRLNRRMQQLQTAESRKQNDIQHSEKNERFDKVVLRREAQALIKATSFDEFKRILLRANLKSTIPKQFSIVLEDGVYSDENKGKTEERLASLSINGEEKRSISKRSLVNKEREIKEVQMPSPSNAYALPSRSITVDPNVTDETEDHSDEELREAYNSYNDFISSACAPRNKTLCTKSLLPRDRTSRSTLLLPPGIYVKRCDNTEWNPFYGGSNIVNSYQAMFDKAAHSRSRMALKSLCAEVDHTTAAVRPGFTEIHHFDAGGSCTCLLPEEECLPTEVRLKVTSVVVYNTARGTTTTEVIALTEHVSCACQRRCDNRRCVSPLQLNNYTFDDCYCSCPEGDVRCEALLDGKATFTDEELPIPLNGSYLLPPCYHGPMDEEHLYHRHCPQPDG